MRRFFVLVVLIFPLPAFAWNWFGHEAVAYIAWQRMSPDQRAAYSEILKAHPHYAEELDVPAGPDHDMQVFMKASTWPDVIRNTPFEDEKADHHSNWHYIDRPITPDHANAEEPKTEQTTADPQNAVQALKFELNILRDKKAPPPARAKALCWVLHLVGDLHQPLHCVSLVDVDFPQGDRGGNSIQIVNSDSFRNLHGLWDGLLGQHGGFVEVAKAADEVTKDYGQKVMERAKDLDAVHWAAEGKALAMKVVYAGLELNDGGELLANVDRTSVNPDRDYLRRARDTAREQIALAGIRLAAILK